MNKKIVRDVLLSGAVTLLLWSSAKADPTARPDGSDLSSLDSTPFAGDRADRITAEPLKDPARIDPAPRELPAIGERPSERGSLKRPTAKQEVPAKPKIKQKLNDQRIDKIDDPVPGDHRAPEIGHNPEVND